MTHRRTQHLWGLVAGIAWLTACVDEFDDEQLLPEPPAAAHDPSAEVLEMCGLEACPVIPPSLPVEDSGPGVILADDVRGPDSFFGAVVEVEGSGADDFRLVTKFEIPTEYADALAAAQLDIHTPEQPVDPELFVSGFGHYCNITWPSGHWAMAWDTGEYSDPCGWLIDQFGTTPTVNRAGVFSRNGLNTVIVRCTNGAYAYRGYGTGPLGAAYDGAATLGPTSCKMTVGPADIPIFSSSPIAGGALDHGTGFDFARPGYTVVPSDYGQAGWVAASRMNQIGKGKGFGIDNHDGHDFGGYETDVVVSVGSGEVIAQRWFNTQAFPTGSTGPWQGEAYIRHDLNRFPSRYTESWISVYAHMDLLSYKVGQYVSAGTALGQVGSRGNSSGPHVHLDIVKLTNPVWGDDREFNFQILPGPGGVGHNGGPVKVDPYGFNAPTNIDPWAWKSGSPNGTISSNLWMSGTAPPHGSWGL